jgi:hypothetical protein
MKRIAIAAAVLAATAFGSVAANAVEVDVGGNGIYVGPRHDYDSDWRWRHRHETYGFGDRCRVIVRTHINRFGERVTERRRICD